MTKDPVYIKRRNGLWDVCFFASHYDALTDTYYLTNRRITYTCGNYTIAKMEFNRQLVRLGVRGLI